MHISSTREGRVARAEPAEVRGQEWIEETEDGTTITASTESVICQDLGNLSFINIYNILCILYSTGLHCLSKIIN